MVIERNVIPAKNTGKLLQVSPSICVLYPWVIFLHTMLTWSKSTQCNDNVLLTVI